MSIIDFSFSDLIAGYVTKFDQATDTFVLQTSDGREFPAHISANCYAELVRNLGEAFLDATANMRDMLVPGRYLFAYGIFYPDDPDGGSRFDAKHLVFLGRTENKYGFEKPDWWIQQVEKLADFYLESEFGDGPVDWSRYRTTLTFTGGRAGCRQETDTISRLIYGFASAYLMTGDDRYYAAAKSGTTYLRDHLRFKDKGAGICYWYHAVDLNPDGSETKIFASEFGDDYDAIPCYEQIYALAGPTQTYRIDGDPLILDDVEHTISLFHRFFRDPSEQGGYYSHLDPVTLSAHVDGLGQNKARKNWNSIGDHAPAYLINLWLATGEPDYANFLELTFDTIVKRFPDYEESPFVQEKFFDNWSKDQKWGWQQNRGVVGHNLKIAWNLMRMNSLRNKESYVTLARKIAAVMPGAGYDRQRGGWYDVLERVLQPGEKYHRCAWHDRKAWWQQEQGILAYLILHGVLHDPTYLRIARESSSFYNAWFLDTDSGGIYFNVLANGMPFVLGTERCKGSHSMSGYHAFELAYLASVYTNLLITKEPMDFHFRPIPGGFKDNLLRVAPDILPEGSIKIGEVWIDGSPYSDFDADKLTVKLPDSHGAIKVRVRLVPRETEFSVDLLDVASGSARIVLAGILNASGIQYLDEALANAASQGTTRIVFDCGDLKNISSEAIRYLLMRKQHYKTVVFVISRADSQIKAALVESELAEEITFA